MNTINATMTTAAMATMETVDAATIMRAFYPAPCIQKPRRRLELLAPCEFREAPEDRGIGVKPDARSRARGSSRGHSGASERAGGAGKPTPPLD